MVEIRSFSNRTREDRRLLREFVDFHWRHYRDEPRYVPLLDYEYLGSRKIGVTGFFERRNFFFEHGESQFFLALRQGQVVGRCNALINEAYDRHWNERAGFFGNFESVDDAEVARALLGAAESWLRGRGATIARGPQNFPMNEATPGVLVEGFESRPVIYYHYNHPYYARLLESCGYSSRVNVLSWEIPIQTEIVEEKLGGLSRKIIERYGVTLERWRERKKSVRKAEMFEIYNDAWSDNFGFAPFERKELDKIVDDMTLVFDRDLFVFAYVRGVPAGFMGAVPNISELLARPGRGRGPEFARLLRMLTWPWKVRGVRLGYLGVKKEYRNLGLDAVMLWGQHKIGLKKGYDYCDMGWVLETNKPIIRMVERCGAQPSKRYAIFEKSLGTPPASFAGE